jgi:hypothetical protein
MIVFYNFLILIAGHHTVVIIFCDNGSYALEKYNTGLQLTFIKGNDIQVFLRRKEKTAAYRRSTITITNPEVTKIRNVLNWIVSSEQLRKPYRWWWYNCQEFAKEFWIHLSNTRPELGLYFDIRNILDSIRLYFCQWERSIIEYHLANLTSPFLSSERVESIARWVWEAPKLFHIISWEPEFPFPVEVFPESIISTDQTVVTTNIAPEETTMDPLKELFVAVSPIVIAVRALFPWTWIESVWKGFLIYSAVKTLYPIGMRLWESFVLKYTEVSKGTIDTLFEDTAQSFPQNIVSIAVVCGAHSKTGDHAFLFLEWNEKNEQNEIQRVFGRADFGPGNTQSSSDLSASTGKIRITGPAIGVEGGRRLMLFEASEILVAKTKIEKENLNIRQVLEELKHERFTYSLSGDHSSTKINSHLNNQNCATFVSYVLKSRFELDLGLNKYNLPIIRTPADIVKIAYRKWK